MIKNLNFRKRISLKQEFKERFINQKEENKTPTKSLDFLKNLDEQDFEEKFTEKKKLDYASLYTDSRPYKELIDYVSKCAPGDVQAGNYFTKDENSANFSSNVLNTHKFYDYHPIGEYDGKTELAPSNYTEPSINKKQDAELLDKVSKQTCFNDRNTHDNTEIFKPDQWVYRNETISNGGAFMNNLVGFDSLDDSFASFLDNDTQATQQNCDVKQDDVRFGLGYSNKEYREVR